MIKVPVVVFKNKSKIDRFLAASMDVGDWEDEELDVSINEIENAFMIWRKDFSKPTEEDLEQLKQESAAHKKLMIEKFGEHVCISYDVEKWLEYYDPTHLEITKEQFNHAKEIAFM